MLDTYTKQKSIEDVYDYNHDGVRKLLENYYALTEQGTYGYDPIVVVIKMDIDRALQSTLLNADHLRILTMRYALQLSFMEIQLYEGTLIEEGLYQEEEAIHIIVDVLNGKSNDYYVYSEVAPADTLSDFLLYVSQGKVSPFNISDALLADLLNLTKCRDELAKEVLRQHNEGPPIFQENVPLDVEYPDYKTSEYIESPQNKGYKKNEYDYFRNQDKKNKVTYEDFTNKARGLQSTGHKKVRTSSEIKGTKGKVYDV